MPRHIVKLSAAASPTTIRTSIIGVSVRNWDAHPQKISTGIETVWVNGVKVWEKDKVTGNLPGAVLRKQN